MKLFFKKNTMQPAIYLLALGLFSISTTYSQTTRKNVLFLMADDFNYWAKCIGYQDLAITPNIDSLASKGVLFTDAHCSGPVCNPSRNALWGGFRPVTTGIQGNSDGYIRQKAGFANIVTMHQYFMNNGYFTYGSGKLWHDGSMGGTTTDPTHWSQINTQSTGCNGGSYTSYSGTFVSYSVNASAMTTSNCGDNALVNQVAALISGYSTSANKDKPFFIGCGVFRPHLPFNMPKQFWDLFNTADITPPKGYKADDLNDIVGGSPESDHTSIVRDGKWMEAIRAYMACCAMSDYNIGIIIDALNKSPYKDNTIILFMGDHGWHFGEKMKWGKNTLYDQANRTTFIVYDPSAKGNGKRCAKVVSLQDIYPTLVELCGLPPKTDIEGRSFAPLLNEPDKADWEWPVMMSYGGTNYIKTNRWRYINSSNPELYETAVDPYEWNNLLFANASQYSTVVTEMKAKIDSVVKIGADLKSKLLANYKFTAQPNVIPGTIEAENYDEGANTKTYFDKTTENSGNSQYRSKDAVDISTTTDLQGAFDVTSTMDGEWLQYSIQTPRKGIYDVDFRINNNSPQVSYSQRIQLWLNEVKVGEVTVPQTGATEWVNVTMPNITISSDKFSTLKVRIVGGSFNINNFTFIYKEDYSSNLRIRDNGSPRYIINNLVRDNHLLLDLTSSNFMVKLNFYDIKGRMIKEDYISGEVKVDYELSNQFAQGTYLLQFNDMITTRIEKFAVKR